MFFQTQQELWCHIITGILPNVTILSEAYQTWVSFGKFGQCLLKRKLETFAPSLAQLPKEFSPRVLKLRCSYIISSFELWTNIQDQEGACGVDSRCINLKVEQEHEILVALNYFNELIRDVQQERHNFISQNWENDIVQPRCQTATQKTCSIFANLFNKRKVFTTNTSITDGMSGAGGDRYPDLALSPITANNNKDGATEKKNKVDALSTDLEAGDGEKMDTVCNSEDSSQSESEKSSLSLSGSSDAKSLNNSNPDQSLDTSTEEIFSGGNDDEQEATPTNEDYLNNSSGQSSPKLFKPLPKTVEFDRKFEDDLIGSSDSSDTGSFEILNDESDCVIRKSCCYNLRPRPRPRSS